MPRKNNRKHFNWNGKWVAKLTKSKSETITDLRRALPHLGKHQAELANRFLNQWDQSWMLGASQWDSVVKLLQRAAANKKKKPQPAGYAVYLIGHELAVKIGISVSPGKRLQNLQTSNHEPLSLMREIRLATRGRARTAEVALHKKCKRLALSGEWFKPEAVALFDSYFEQKPPIPPVAEYPPALQAAEHRP